MKILVLGPMDYPSARKDLILFNHNQKVYSSYYLLEGLIMSEIKRGRVMENQTAVAMYLGMNLTDKEYNSADVFFGFVPRRFHFDKVISYDPALLEAQEMNIINKYKEYRQVFWNSDDITDTYPNIMEAIKSVELKPTERN